MIKIKDKTLTSTVTTEKSMKNDHPLRTRTQSSYLVTIGDVGLITPRTRLKASINRRRAQRNGHFSFSSTQAIVFIFRNPYLLSSFYEISLYIGKFFPKHLESSGLHSRYLVSFVIYCCTNFSGQRFDARIRAKKIH